MDVSTEIKSCYGKPDAFPFYAEFYGTDFHLTKEEAVKDCEKRKEKKIRSLEKQLLKIKKLPFKTDPRFVKVSDFEDCMTRVWIEYE